MVHDEAKIITVQQSSSPILNFCIKNSQIEMENQFLLVQHTVRFIWSAFYDRIWEMVASQTAHGMFDTNQGTGTQWTVSGLCSDANCSRWVIIGASVVHWHVQVHPAEGWWSNTIHFIAAVFHTDKQCLAIWYSCMLCTHKWEIHIKRNYLDWFYTCWVMAVQMSGQGKIGQNL